MLLRGVLFLGAFREMIKKVRNLAAFWWAIFVDDRPYMQIGNSKK